MTDNPFKWYISTDEETYHATTAITREGAIHAGRDEYGDEEFYICEAKTGVFPYHALFRLDRIFEAVIYDYEDLWGEDQESIFRSTVSNEMVNDLDDMLIETFKAWVAKHGVVLEEPWAFEEMRNMEKIEGSVE